jgi:glycosyltransferase involved in cell wall biosynthesis
MTGHERPLVELVVCSLEPWDEVWRRNQLIVSELLDMESELRVLFVGPPVDAPYEARSNRRVRLGRGTSMVGVHEFGGRLTIFEPTKWLPRAVGTYADRVLVRSVERQVRSLGFSQPVLWVNNMAMAELMVSTGWPTVYDVTDDWLAGPCGERERARRIRDEDLLLSRAQEVVVCSPALAESKGRDRPVRLVTNGVDTAWIRRSMPRPQDLPPGPYACYVGSLHDGRIDVDLCIDVARAVVGRASLVLVGPDALDASSRRRLEREAAVVMTGPRPHAAVPGYLQHADVLLVPHVRTPFTESLDPIKSYEYRAVGRPIVTTSVAGFRDAGHPAVVADSTEQFVDAVCAQLPGIPPPPELLPAPADLPTWRSSAEKMLEALRGANEIRAIG